MYIYTQKYEYTDTKYVQMYLCTRIHIHIYIHIVLAVGPTMKAPSHVHQQPPTPTSLTPANAKPDQLKESATKMNTIITILILARRKPKTKIGRTKNKTKK